VFPGDHVPGKFLLLVGAGRGVVVAGFAGGGGQSSASLSKGDRDCWYRAMPADGDLWKGVWGVIEGEWIARAVAVMGTLGWGLFLL